VKLNEVRHLLKEFGRTLGKHPDEWWGSEQAVWRELSKKFTVWLSKNREELDKLREKDKYVV